MVKIKHFFMGIMGVGLVLAILLIGNIGYSQQNLQGKDAVPKDLKEKEQELDTQINTLYEMYSYFYKVFYLTKDKQGRAVKDKIRWIPYKMSLMWQCPPRNQVSQVYIDPRDYGLMKRTDGEPCIMAELHDYDVSAGGITGIKRKLLMLYYSPQGKLEMVVSDVFGKSLIYEESTKYFRVIDNIKANPNNRNKMLIIPIIENPFRFTKPEAGKESDIKAKIQIYILDKSNERYLEDVRLRAESPLRNEFKAGFYIPYLQHFYAMLNRVVQIYNFLEKDVDGAAIKFLESANEY